MASGTIQGAGVASVTFSSTDNLAMAQSIAGAINTGLTSTPATLTAFTYSGTGNVAPEPASGSGGVAIFTAPTSGAVFVDGADQFIVVNANGPVSLQGGAAGGTLIAGAGLPGADRNITYTNITPSGNATDTIVVAGGNNLIQTATFGTGNYNVATGSGNDTINILIGNSTINAATGFNQINLGSGGNLITSVGYDLITGASVGGGSDTVNVTSGNTSINSGTSNFLINDSSSNPLLVTLGFGVDTVNITGGGPATVKGISTTTTTSGNATVVGTDLSSGDSITVSGGSSTVVAAGNNDTVRALSGNNLLVAGTGNDTLVAGSGSDTLTGAIGGSSSAFLSSGLGAGTTFSFTAGKSGGSDTISGFKAADFLSFTGYGGQPQGSAITSGGNTIITLVDGTTITLAGATPAAGQFIIK